jgi:hypothetical protein
VSCNLLVLLLLPLQLCRRLVLEDMLEDIRYMAKELDIGEAFSLSLFQREMQIGSRALES